jgi:hypothetical protein
MCQDGHRQLLLDCIGRRDRMSNEQEEREAIMAHHKRKREELWEQMDASVGNCSDRESNATHQLHEAAKALQAARERGALARDVANRPRKTWPISPKSRSKCWRKWPSEGR